MLKFVYAYAHGFLSTNKSRKASKLRKKFSSVSDQEVFQFCCDSTTGNDWDKCSSCRQDKDGTGVRLHILNCNRGPDPSTAGYGNGKAAIDDLYAVATELAGREVTIKLRLIGSSMGGFVCAQYATTYPDRVDAIVLLNPGVDLRGRIKANKGGPVWHGLDFDEWKCKGFHEFCVGKQQYRVSSKFLDEVETLPTFPQYQCRALWIHGNDDEVVPIKLATLFLSENLKQQVLTEFVSIDDDHDMLRKVDYCVERMFEFFDFQINKRIEVESVVAVSQDTVPLLIEKVFSLANSTLVCKTEYWDRYYDISEQFPLCHSKIFLRQRAGKWEMKEQKKSSDTYDEARHHHEILERINDVCVKKWSSLSEALQELWCYAEFKTTRKKFVVEGVVVDVDETNFNYSSVDVEIMCDSVDSTALARAKIDKILKLLDLPRGPPSDSKLVKFLENSQFSTEIFR